MLSQTSELAIQILLCLLLEEDREPVPPRRIASVLDASPTYLAKVAGILTKAGILRAVRGVHGGVIIAKDPAKISLLEVVESCQGKILGDYCSSIVDDFSLVCSYHEAMFELHKAVITVLGRWTIADLAEKPCPHESIRESIDCKMAWCRKKSTA